METIRPIDCNELSAVQALARESFETRWSAQDFSYFLGHDQRLCLGLFQEKTLVAYFLGLCVQGELDVISLATAQTCRRQGLGFRLLSEALQTGGVLSAHLEVDVRNEGAIALYKKCGFQVTGLRKLYYDGKSDALLMTYRV